MRTAKNIYVCSIAVALCALMAPRTVSAQVPDDGWRVSVYPVFVWAPLGIAIDLNLPPIGGGGGGSGPDFGGEIIDGRFDGAFMGGVSAAKGAWRIDLDGLWAAVGGDRPERPTLTVDVDAIYGHVSGGRKIFPDFYVTAGVRRFALDYDIVLNGQDFLREPGVWDPLVGVGWHRMAGNKLELHAIFEGGGFGVGADTDVASTFRFDWKPATHFGLTGGYTFLYFKISDEVLGQAFTVKQTLHGPIVGIGLYF